MEQKIQELINIFKGIEKAIDKPLLQNYELLLGFGSTIVLIVTLIYLIKYTIATQQMKEEVVKSRKDIFLPSLSIISVNSGDMGSKFIVKIFNDGKGRAFFKDFKIITNQKEGITERSPNIGRIFDKDKKHAIELFTIRKDKEFFHNNTMKLFFSDIFGRKIKVQRKIVFDSERNILDVGEEASEMELLD
ncbi:hypothetical protein KJ885_04870 [Patescibacteria group bacterium]|nr:hypothetical protein [Patescibacteria group bacterium]